MGESKPPEELEIELVETAPEDLPAGEDPRERPGQSLLPLGKPHDEAVIVAAYPCLKQLLAHGQRGLERSEEVAGVLLGGIWRCPGGRVTELREALCAEKTEAGLGHVTFSHESWNLIHDYVDQCAPGTRIVGWYHTHPGLGVFFSGQDRFIQRNFFAGEGQVGLVYDPQCEALAGFEERQGEVLALPGLWVCAPEESVRAARALLHRLTFAGAGADRGGLLSGFGRLLGGKR